MKKFLISLPVFLAFFALSPAFAQQENSYVHDQSDGYVWPLDATVREKLDAWQDLKFGVLMHWGLYSVPGIVESWSICNEDWVTRPKGSQYDEYKKWYWGLAQRFNPTAFDPAKWADICRTAGMKYMIFTTKHHDGFCMYDSRQTDFSIAKAGPFAQNPKSDVARHVFDAFREKGFWIGVYYSKPDWHCPWYWNPYYATPDRHENYRREQHPDWWENYVAYTQSQLRELTGGGYGKVDILWLDGGWVSGNQVGLSAVLEEARKVSPGLLSVDRTIQGPDENYQTPERGVPSAQLGHPWESCIPLSDDWGWTPQPRYKSARRVVGTLAEIVAKGGCFVLGVGPTPEGGIEPRATAILLEVGDWMKRCGKAVYGTRTTAHYTEGNGLWFSQSKDGKTRYAIYALPDGEKLPDSLSWTELLPKGGKVKLLNTGQTLSVSVGGGKATLRLPKDLRQEPLAFSFSL